MKTRLDFFYKRNKENYKYDYILNFQMTEKTFLKDLKDWIQSFTGHGYIQFYSVMSSNENKKLKQITKKYALRIFEFKNGIVKLKNKTFKG